MNITPEAILEIRKVRVNILKIKDVNPEINDIKQPSLAEFSFLVLFGC